MKKNKIMDINNFNKYLDFLKNSKNIKEAYIKSIVSKNCIIIPISSGILKNQLRELGRKFKRKKIYLDKISFNSSIKKQVGFLVLDKYGLSRGVLLIKRINNENKINLKYQFDGNKKNENIKIETINRILNWCSDTLNIKKFVIDISENLKDFNLFNNKILRTKSKKYIKNRKIFEISNDVTDNNLF